MKRITLCFFVLLSFSTQAQVYWNEAGNNSTSGRIIISGNSPSTGYDDIEINRNKPDAGIRIFNENPAGRSVIMFGQGFGSRYGYLAYHGETHDAGSGRLQTYKPMSTILSGAGANGLGIISNSDIRFNTGGDLDTQLRMILTSDGRVGIGTTNPGSFKLAVEGKIGAREVNVMVTNPWPDYVFEKGYNLLPLSELETYITQNKHLPEVPSAKEVEADGLNLKEMNLILLKKVEELTLHVIALKKENEEIKRIINK